MPASAPLQAHPQRHNRTVSEGRKSDVHSHLLGLQRPVEVIPPLQNPSGQGVHQKKTADHDRDDQQGELHNRPDRTSRRRHPVAVHLRLI